MTLPTTTTLDITPSTDLVYAIRHMSGVNWRRAISELVDNCFDARACSVTIAIAKDSFTISDDGNGCPDLGSMLKLGGRYQQPGDTLGRYGYGLKGSAIWMGNKIGIATSDGTTLRTTSVAWTLLKKWEALALEIPSTSRDCRSSGIANSKGTAIVISGKLRKLDPRALENVLNDLGYVFQPALAEGGQIKVVFKGKRRTVRACSWPDPLEHQMNVAINVQGKTATVLAGIVPRGAFNEHCGFNIIYKHRVIQSTTEPCGEYNPDRFFAVVTLSKSWTLTTLKDAVEGQASLYEELRAQCQLLLIKAAEEGQTLELDAIRNTAERLIEDALGGKRKRGKGDKPGTVYPTGTGTKHNPKTGRSIRIVYTDWQRGNGKVEVNKDSILIKLSRAHPFSAVTEHSAELQAMMAISLLADHVSKFGDEKQKQRLLPGMSPGGDFVDCLDEVTKSLAATMLTKKRKLA